MTRHAELVTRRAHAQWHFARTARSPSWRRDWLLEDIRDFDTEIAAIEDAYGDALPRYRAAAERRLIAVDRAEAATRALASALADMMAAAAEMRQAAAKMNLNERGRSEADGALDDNRLGHRMVSHMRGVLRAALGGTKFGPIAIGPKPGDLSPDATWRDAEAQVCGVEHFESMAPVVAEQSERAAA